MVGQQEQRNCESGIGSTCRASCWRVKSIAKGVSASPVKSANLSVKFALASQAEFALQMPGFDRVFTGMLKDVLH